MAVGGGVQQVAASVDLVGERGQVVGGCAVLVGGLVEVRGAVARSLVERAELRLRVIADRVVAGFASGAETDPAARLPPGGGHVLTLALLRLLTPWQTQGNAVIPTTAVRPVSLEVASGSSPRTNPDFREVPVSDPGDDTLRESEAPGADGSRVGSFRASGSMGASASGEVRESQRAGDEPEVRPPVHAAGEAGGGDPELGSLGSAGDGWPPVPGQGERVDHGGGTVADAIRSAMARRS